VIVTANCLKFLTYLLSCVENDVIDCVDRGLAHPKMLADAPMKGRYFASKMQMAFCYSGLISLVLNNFIAANKM